MLKISELRQRKQDLEAEIAKLIHQFEADTGVQLDSLVSVVHLNQESVNEVNNAIQVEVHLDV